MGRMFDFDGPLVTFLERVADIIILNLLFIVCCIPVFTIGASITALSAITQKMSRNEEGYIVRGYFKAFKQNFLQATAIWLILLVLGVIFIMDFYILQKTDTNAVMFVVQSVLFVLGIVYIFEYIYVFPVLAKFDNTLVNTMRNALLLSIRYLPRTVVLILLTVLPVIVGIFYLQFIMPVFIMAGFSLISLASAYIFKGIFDPLIEGSESPGESTEE